MRIVCYGDSNTYGYDPRNYIGSRYNTAHRWADILADRINYPCENWGVNGQQIPQIPVAVPPDTTLLIIMLGTNDLLVGKSVTAVTASMEKFLTSVSANSHRIILIAPPYLQRGTWVSDKELIEKSKVLSSKYRDLAEKMGILFCDASKWNTPISFDGVHLTEEGHIIFAENIYKYLCALNLF